MLQNQPMRNALTSAVGARAGADVHVVEETLQGGELIAMTTDGVHGALDDARIQRLLAEGGDPAAMATNLVRSALALGSRDNCTAIVGQYLSGLLCWRHERQSRGVEVDDGRRARRSRVLARAPRDSDPRGSL